MKRFVPWLAVIIALLIIAAVLRQCRNAGAANYQTAMIMRGPVTQAVTATGTLNPVINVQVGSQVSGNIAKLSADFNSQVKAGQVVAQIDPALFQATVTQAEADVGVVKIDQNVDFTVDAFPVETFHGKVVQVRNAPITVQNVVTYDTVIGVSNPDLKLKPGMTANVSIIIAHKDDVLQIKNAALRYRPPDATPVEIRKTVTSRAGRPGPGRGGGGQQGAQRTVYVLPSGANHPEPRQINTGISDGIMTEVVEGLKEGDRVVTAELASTAAGPSPPANPFGGSRRFP